MRGAELETLGKAKKIQQTRKEKESHLQPEQIQKEKVPGGQPFKRRF
jgi:hypothetical protein